MYTVHVYFIQCYYSRILIPLKEYRKNEEIKNKNGKPCNKNVFQFA